MSEPRTRSAAEVADHASILVDEAQQANEDCPTCGRPRSGEHPDGPYGRCEDCPPEVTLACALGLIERLAAQVEDLAAAVAGAPEDDGGVCSACGVPYDDPNHGDVHYHHVN